MPSLDWLIGSPQPTGSFTPNYEDVCRTRALLKALRLPTELVLDILDYAHYWPTHEFKARSDQACTAATGRSSAAKLCLDAALFDNPTVDDIRTGGELFKVKAVEFEFLSSDQGWTSERTQGTFSTSSWLEVSILRDPTNNRNPPSDTILRALGNTVFSGPLSFHTRVSPQGWLLVKRPDNALQGPQGGEGDLAWYLQGNRVASEPEEYRVVWGEDGCEGNEGAGKGEGFLKELKDGDRVLVWARAKYPGWQSKVDSVKVTVRYGF